MNKYSLDYIEKLRIHELRDYAKKLGVSSPTTLKKDELISKINDLIICDEFTSVGNNHESKNDGFDFFDLLISDNSSLLESLLSVDSSTANKSTMLVKKTNPNTSNFTSVEPVLPITFQLQQGKAEYSTQEISRISGYIDIHPNGYGILRVDGFVPNDNDAFFTSAMVKKYKLQKGMFITGNAKYVMEGKPRVVYEIVEIQDKNSFKNIKYFDELNVNGLGDELVFDNYDIRVRRGERQYVESINLEDAVAFSLELVEENRDYVKLINIKARPEDLKKSNGKMEIINIPFNKTEVEVINAVDLVLERAKRECEIGKNNVVVIYNFCELIRIINIAFEGRYECEKFNSKTINKVYNLLYTARHFDNDISCTIIGMDSNGVTKDLKDLMTLEFLPLFNKIQSTITRR